MITIVVILVIVVIVTIVIVITAIVIVVVIVAIIVIVITSWRRGRSPARAPAAPRGSIITCVKALSEMSEFD